MGHIVNPNKDYQKLQQRLDRTITGAPNSPVFMKLLKLLFKPQDAKIAHQLPTKFETISSLSRKIEIPQPELEDIMTDMAQRGLVIDLEYKGKRYISLAPVIIGFFEFTFMRTRDDMPMKEIAELFDKYMTEDDRFARSVFEGNTQIGRTLVNEDEIPNDYTEILDWERVTHLIKTSRSLGVSLCACRHHHQHLGDVCDAPMETCLSLNLASETMVKSGISRSISIEEALDILTISKEAGLAQTGDNVQRNPTYICNCCGCCCGMIQAMKTFDLTNAIVTSNWVVQIDEDKCNGCGKCEAACPVDAIQLTEYYEGKRKKRKAVPDVEMCLGCGVCPSSCDKGALTMKPREKRVFTPETVFDKMVSMAVERGKLADLIFEDPEKLSHRALGRMIKVIENSPPVKATMAIEPLRSVFINGVVKAAKKITGPVSEKL